jgi:carbonic anhydrase/acetyltransferase-like protein (isoleucine patch superfamily)
VKRGLAVVLATPTVLAPFGDPARAAYFCDETIAEAQARALDRAGFDVVAASDVAAAIAQIRGAGARPVLLLLDRIFVTSRAVRGFVRAVQKARAKDGGPARAAALALSINASVEYTLPLQDVRLDQHRVVHDVVWVDPSALPPEDDDPVRWAHALRDAARPVEVPKRELVVEAPLPVIGERAATTLRYPITSTIVVSIEHWAHVLWLNQIAFGIRWVELIERRPLWALGRALAGLSWHRDHILMRLVHRGRGARVHPTATLSGSIVGPGAVIGPHVTLKNTIVGAGAVVQDHAVLLNSVVGARALIMENTFMVSTVTYPEATVGNYKLQVSLIGRGAYVHPWAGFIDANFAGPVRVTHRGALVSSERQFIGSVVGHRACVAAKVLIHPGREIPNDALIVMRPDEVVSVVPADIQPGVPMVRDRGTLVPLGREGKE